MHRFSYEAADSHGRRIVASAEAWNKEALLIDLQSNGMVLIRWLDEEPGRKSLFKRSKKKLREAELLQMTKDLAHLLGSGVTMDKALTIISDSAKRETVKSMARSLKESIQGGMPLSQALSLRPEDFKDLYVNMVRVGELGGILPQVMDKLSQFLARSREIKKFIVSSAIYPTILFAVGIVSILVIMGFVVPSFAGIFSDLGQEIPFSTQVLIQASDFLRSWGWLAALLIFLGLGLSWRIAHRPSGRAHLDRLLLRLPFIGEMTSDIHVSRFARTLGTLILSGVPLLKALSIVGDVVENSIVKKAIDHIYREVKNGKRISSLMNEQDVFPSMAVQMVALGEETGKLGEMLVLVAEELDTKTQDRIRVLLSFLEPVTIVAMGIIIGGIVISMLSAVFGINEIQF